MSSENSQRVAVVTGSNKGIGFEIVKGLCKKFDGIVFLTSRDVARGEAAVKKLQEEGLNPFYHQLDITDLASIETLRDDIKNQYRGIDLLINNAGIVFPVTAKELPHFQAEITMKVNYYGTLRVCEILFPLLKQNARVINMSSSEGHLSKVMNADLRSKIGSKNLTFKDLEVLVKKYLTDVKDNKRAENGWPRTSYSASKVFITALSFIQQRKLDLENSSRNISVNVVHPGYVQTDMTRHTGPFVPEEGAKSPLFVALEADFKGEYVWYDGKPLDWYAENIPSNFPNYN